MSAQVISAADAANLIRDAQTIAVDGFTMMGVADEVYAAIETSFLETGTPKNLTLMHASGQSNRIAGMERFAHRDLLKRIVGSHWGLAPKLGALIGDDNVEGVCLPQGQLASLYRAIAADRPGNLSRVGLGTFVDPRIEGGRVNARAKEAVDPEEYVQLMVLDGKEYLRFRPIHINVGILRATRVDTAGNASQEGEASGLDALSLAQAVRNSGGIVICQARELVENGAIAARHVTVPGNLIDYVVPVTDVDAYHRQSDNALDNASLLGGYASPTEVAASLASHPVDQVRLKIGERGAQLVRSGDVINVGTGIPGDTIGIALAKRGLLVEVTLTIESGVYGGVPLGGTDFGAARHPSAIITHAAQFDFYNGGGTDIAFMGAGQISPEGNVNVSKLGGRMVGVGGFMDILSGARRICFLAATGGRHQKFVDAVDHLSFSGQRALAQGQEVYLATEFYTLQLTTQGWKVHGTDDSLEARETLAAIPFPILENRIDAVNH